MASSRYGTRSRLTMKAVESFVCTGTLPTARTHSVAAVMAAGSTRMVLTTSTSFMSGTGLKKCRPSTWRGRVVAAAIAVTLQEDVLVASRAWGAQMRSSLAKVSFLSAWFSVIASTTRSTALRSSRRGVPAMRPSVSSLAEASSLPLATRPSIVFLSRSSPRLTSSVLASTNRTWKPACAATCTMPEPIRPQPMTPTFLIAMRSCSASVTRATTGQRRWLDVTGFGRARVADGHRHVAVADAAVGLHFAVARAGGGAFLAQRLVEGVVARVHARGRHVQEHGGADGHLHLVGGGGHRQREGGDEEQSGASYVTHAGPPRSSQSPAR